MDGNNDTLNSGPGRAAGTRAGILGLTTIATGMALILFSGIGREVVMWTIIIGLVLSFVHSVVRSFLPKYRQPKKRTRGRSHE